MTAAVLPPLDLWRCKCGYHSPIPEKFSNTCVSCRKPRARLALLDGIGNLRFNGPDMELAEFLRLGGSRNRFHGRNTDFDRSPTFLSNHPTKPLSTPPVASVSSGYSLTNDDFNIANIDADQSLDGSRDPPLSEQHYIHIILVDLYEGKKQVPVDISNHSSDYQVFERLNEVYREHRARWRVLMKLKNLTLVKVSSTFFALARSLPTRF